MERKQKCDPKGIARVSGDDRTFVLIEEGGSDYKFCTNNPQMVNILNRVREMDAFPFEAVLQRKNLAGNKIN